MAKEFHNFTDGGEPDRVDPDQVGHYEEDAVRVQWRLKNFVDRDGVVFRAVGESIATEKVSNSLFSIVVGFLHPFQGNNPTVGNSNCVQDDGKALKTASVQCS